MKKLFVFSVLCMLGLINSVSAEVKSITNCIESFAGNKFGRTKIIFTLSEIAQLCTGANSNAPAKCVKDILSFSDYFDSQSLALVCSGSTSDAAASCVVNAEHRVKASLGGLPGIAKLCAKSTSLENVGVRADCVIDALKLVDYDFNADQLLQMCGSL